MYQRTVYGLVKKVHITNLSPTTFTVRKTRRYFGRREVLFWNSDRSLQNGISVSPTGGADGSVFQEKHFSFVRTKNAPHLRQKWMIRQIRGQLILTFCGPRLGGQCYHALDGWRESPSFGWEQNCFVFTCVNHTFVFVLRRTLQFRKSLYRIAGHWSGTDVWQSPFSFPRWHSVMLCFFTREIGIRNAGNTSTLPE